MVEQFVHFSTLFVDEGGTGSGVVDTLAHRGIPVIGVKFGGRANARDKYSNKRAEMYELLNQWLGHPRATFPKDTWAQEALREELGLIEYKIKEVDGTTELAPKSKIKKEAGISPDVADVAAMLFAEPVALPNRYDDMPQGQTLYCGGVDDDWM